MDRCKACGEVLVADGTEDRDWAEYCEYCEEHVDDYLDDWDDIEAS